MRKLRTIFDSEWARGDGMLARESAAIVVLRITFPKRSVMISRNVPRRIEQERQASPIEAGRLDVFAGNAGGDAVDLDRPSIV
ncbi:MAG: hypothetical protein ABJB74_15990 [Gemmatimonas sp.]